MSQRKNWEHIYVKKIYVYCLQEDCSEAEIEPVLENMNLSYLAQNQSSVTRLKQFVYRCQMYNTTES